MHFVCVNDDADAKFFQRPHADMQALQEVCKTRSRLLELQRCEKLSGNASIVHKSYIRH